MNGMKELYSSTSFRQRDGNPDSDADPEIWKPFYRQHQPTYELIKYLLAKYWRFMFPYQLQQQVKGMVT